MSRAFVKEPDAPEPRCPEPRGCGGRGAEVGRFTVRSNVGDDAAATLTDPVHFCDDSTCPVVYFDSAGGRIETDTLVETRWPKAPDAPLCPCFGLHEEEITEWGRDGRTDRMRELLAKAEGPDARCLSRTLDGRPCVQEARRLFLLGRQDAGTD